MLVWAEHRMGPPVTGDRAAPDAPAAGDVGAPTSGDGRQVARVLRWVRLVTAGMLVMLAMTAWHDTWPIPGRSVEIAVGVMVAWLLGTNVWSRRHDGRHHEDDGVRVEVASDLLLALAITVVGGELVARTLPLLGVLVVVELAVRWPRRDAFLATGLYVATSVAAIVARWPSWAGWDRADLLVDILPAVVALPIALVLVSGLAVDRSRTRDVAIGQTRRLALVARQLRDANEQLAIANDELSAFAGRIAHDLRSPVGTVVTALETLQRSELDLPEDTREFLLDQALRAATRSVDTIEALLDHAAAEGRAAEVALVDVGELAADVISTLPATLLGTIQIELPRDPALAWADPQLLPLVLQNLVSNALTHGGPDMHRIALVTDGADGALVVSIEDDGVGIPAERRDEVFTAGEASGDRGGLGLGLATCQSIVLRHGGRIWADESRLGGAAVRFTLPWPDDRQPTDRRGALDAARPPVLDLDDEPTSDDQGTRATISSSGSSRRTWSRSYRPGSAPTTSSTSSPRSSASRTSDGTV